MEVCDSLSADDSKQLVQSITNNYTFVMEFYSDSAYIRLTNLA